MNQQSPKTSPRQLILGQLRHPLKLRFVICLTMFGLWYFFFFMPLAEETQTTTARIGREQKRMATAREIEQLKKDLAPYQELIPAKPATTKDLGPYESFGL
jgi:hypothetical protein